MQLRVLVIGLVIFAACGDNIHPGGETPDTPARVVTAITPNPLTAGDTLTATCKVLGENGNLLEGYSPTFSISPVDPNTAITNLTAIVTKAGHYAGQCSIPEIAGDNVGFDVIHALPAKIMIGKSPDQTVYRIAVPITITHTVVDKYDNAIDDAMVINTSMP